ncbi:MAG: sarcosine oxidase subunit gamma [Alcaligenaceae bacterium]|nr:sarcosine oxidase subunit gamma [Alcaligenaceae bacterium]
MSIDLNMQSPLAHMQALLEAKAVLAPDRFLLQELPFREWVNLRAGSGLDKVNGILQDNFNLELPLLPNTVVSSESHAIWWLGPDEWLLQSIQETGRPTLALTLQAGLENVFARALDVSSGYTLLHLSGSEVAGVLNKGCPLDLDASVFAVGQCAHSHFFKADIALRPVSDGWHVLLRRSFAGYAVQMLLDAAHDCYLDAD